ncbi:MAG: glycosyltransferase family 4 protein [Treponema sp.]|nr:glycosyltransferase family 4 protein [Treponema sp.]MDY3885845.1 glycosyltransferase family 4 protein [Treponema sp.]
MNNAIYIKDFIYKYGGTESFTSRLIYSLQKISQDDKILIITEHYIGTEYCTIENLVENIKTAYGINIDKKNLLLKFIEIRRKSSRFSHYYLQSSILKITHKYDRFFYCSRGLIVGNAKKNICIIHFPPEKKSSFSFYSKYKIFLPFAKRIDRRFSNKYDMFVPNSNFTAYYLKENWNIPDCKIKMTYHPVNLLTQACKKEKGSILICSRIEKSKKIEELINAFKKSDFLFNNCYLTVAGSIKNESVEYRQYLMNLCPKVTFVFEPSNIDLQHLYSKSEIFWHAKGYNETNPYLMEHFGLTTVEAMSVGCVPVVINKGGQSEIVTDDCGYRWNTLEELILYTEKLFKNSELLKNMSYNAKKRSEFYSTENFIMRLKQELYE